MLIVEDLVKTYRGNGPPVVAVDGVSFETGEADLLTLLGPSGCGKSTTLRGVAGLERPDTGRIVVADRVLFSSATATDVPAHRRGLGLVFQSYAIWPHMNVFQNAAFPLVVAPRRKRLPKAEVRRRVEQVLAAVRLDHLATRPATDLSGGQQQRLALARALALQPRLLLLDEPLSNLDARLREEMRFELKRLQRELQVTAVYVTHDQVEALAMSNVIAIMRDGRIEQVGRPRDIYDRPASRFVADFVGAANLVEGVVESRQPDGVVCVATDIGLIRVASSAPVVNGAPVVVVVRPEHVSLHVGEAPHGANWWRGRVLATGYLGDAVDHVVAVGSLTIRSRTAPSASATWGTDVTLGVAPEHTTLVPGG